MRKYNGIIAFFDNEEGSVFCVDSRVSYYIHSSAVSKEDLAKLTRGTKVIFTLYTNLYMSQVETLTLIKE